MKFDHINRRTHLYLGMFLLPWFFVYAVSALPFSHHDFFDEIHDDGIPQWTVAIDRAYQLDVPHDAELRIVGARLMAEAGLEGAFHPARSGPARIMVYQYNFWSSQRLTYFVDEGRLLAEQRRFRWDQFLTGIHARGGFRQESFLDDSWAVVVDLVCVAMLTWIASGLYMWWSIRRSRMWGAIAIGGGVLSFTAFLITL